MNLRTTLAIAVSLLATTLFSGVAAQETTFYGESVDVQLVLVDVFASTSDSGAVLDLTKDDFELFEDGEPVEIAQFSVLGVAGRGAGVDGKTSTFQQETDLPPARIVVFIDYVHLGVGNREAVFDQLWDVLKKELQPDDEVMVVTYDGNIDIKLPMTNDRRNLRLALANEGGMVALTSSLSDERVLQLIEWRQKQELDATNRGGDPCVDLGFIARTHAEQVHAGMLQALDNMQAFVNSLAGYPGRKALLHVSDGIPLTAGLEAYSYAIELCDGSGAAKGLPNAIDVTVFPTQTRWDPTKAWAEILEFNTASEWTQLAAEANTYQVSIYAMQASGLGSMAKTNMMRARTSAQTDMAARRNDQDVLFLLSDETGGQAILDTNELSEPFGSMVEDTRVGYQLAYTPPTPGDSKSHEIRVKVKRPGVDLRYRKSYESKNLHQRIADGVQSTLFHGRMDNPLNLRLETTETETANRRVTNVNLRIHVPLKSLVLIPEGETEKGVFTVYVAARNQQGLYTAVGQKTIPLVVEPNDLEQDPNREYLYEVEVPLHGKDYRVGVAVRDDVSGDVSYISQKVLTEEG